MLDRKDELKARIEAKQHELQACMVELEADARAAAREERSRVKNKLEELQRHLRSGWDKMTDKVEHKLNEWLKS